MRATELVADLRAFAERLEQPLPDGTTARIEVRPHGLHLRLAKKRGGVWYHLDNCIAWDDLTMLRVPAGDQLDRALVSMLRRLEAEMPA